MTSPGWRIDRILRSLAKEREEKLSCGEITRAYSRFSIVLMPRLYICEMRKNGVRYSESHRVSMRKLLACSQHYTFYKRALSPRKRHRRIVAEKTYGRAQQRASFLSGQRILCELSYHCIKLYWTNANLCCFLFERELCTCHRVRRSLRCELQSERLGQNLTNTLKKIAYKRTIVLSIMTSLATREERTIEKFLDDRETPR